MSIGLADLAVLAQHALGEAFGIAGRHTLPLSIDTSCILMLVCFCKRLVPITLVLAHITVGGGEIFSLLVGFGAMRP